MILTDREIFLLIICTVFYITLFILVIQNNRRKIQLLQSRLDNIHAMQKMAVIEQRSQDTKTIYNSDIYLRIKKYMNEGRSMTESDWAELSEAVNNVYTGFTEKLYSLHNMSDQDITSACSSKYGFSPRTSQP